MTFARTGKSCRTGAALALSVVVLILGASDAWAVWLYGNGTAYTAGQQLDPMPAPPPANNEGLDGKFTQIQQDGMHGIKVSISACCTATGYCAAPEPNEGVFVSYTITVVAPGGTFVSNGVKSSCPITCIDVHETILSAAYGGAATSVRVDVYVACTCCGAGEGYTIETEHSFDYPVDELEPGT